MSDSLAAVTIAEMLQRTRLRTSTEAVLQIDIETALTGAGFPFQREKSLGPKDRPDFIVFGSTIIEAKARYSKRAIYRQLERYAGHEMVTGIILVTNTALGMPPRINGKPIYVVSVGLGSLGC
jgi:hypothetical protein